MTSCNTQLCNNIVVGHPLRPEQLCLQLPTPFLTNDTQNNGVDFFKSIVDLSLHTQLLQKVEQQLDEQMFQSMNFSSNKASAFTPIKQISALDCINFRNFSNENAVKDPSFDNQSVNTDVLTKEGQYVTEKDNDSSENKSATSKSLVMEENEISNYEYYSNISSPKVLIKELEKIYIKIGGSIPKRDRMHNNLMKSLKKFLESGFKKHCPEFETATKQEKSEKFEQWLTSYIESFFGTEIDAEFNQSLYQGKWTGFEFIFGSFICKDTMKQKISSSREKAYFYGLQKCFKNSSQKKLAIMLKNSHLIYLLEHLFSTNKIQDVLSAY